MKTLTVMGTLAVALALTACGRPDDGGTDAAANQQAEQRAEDSSSATVDNSRDAAGASNSRVDPVAGTTVNRPSDPAQGNSYGSDASGNASAGGHDAVVTGTPQGAQMGERAAQSVENATDRAAQSTENAAERTGQALGNVGERAGDATARGVDAAGDAISDAAITASVNAQLARDDELSALGINVDTDAGRVTLSGTAPSQDAIQRATRLAQQVRGVKDVRNALRVEAR